MPHRQDQFIENRGLGFELIFDVSGDVIQVLGHCGRNVNAIGAAMAADGTGSRNVPLRLGADELLNKVVR